jgi:hypothetical protein
MRLEGTDAPLLVAEDDEFLAEQLYLFRPIAELIRRADRLPVAAQEPPIGLPGSTQVNS